MCGLIMQLSIIMPKLTPRSSRWNASGNSKYPYNFLIGAIFKLISVPFMSKSQCMGPWITNKQVLGTLRESDQQISSFCARLAFSDKYLNCLAERRKDRPYPDPLPIHSEHLSANRLPCTSNL